MRSSTLLSAEPATAHDERARAAAPSDSGFTLVEIIVVMVVSGVLVAALATAFSAVVRTSPSTGDRLDDARSTRSLSTWLSHDTTSTPPFVPEASTGGFDVTASSTGTNNDCAGAGTNIVHMQWTEAIPTYVSYVANYRFVIEGDSARVYRYSCSASNGDPYALVSARALTPELDPSAVPVADLETDATGRVAVVAFRLTGLSGESVLVETSSRNPSDFFS